MGTQAAFPTVSTAPFEGNMLTTDARDVRNDAHSDQTRTPTIAWGGPSFILAARKL